MINIDNNHVNIDNGKSRELPASASVLFGNSIWINYLKKKSSNPNSFDKNRVKNLDYPSKRWGHSSTIYNKKMIIFGGRQSTKSLANIYSFDLDTNTWQKIDPIGHIPPARDSHSTILVRYYI